MIAKEVTETYSWAWLIFTTFVMITSLGVINLIIVVICDAVAKLHRANFQQEMKFIRDASNEMHSNHNGIDVVHQRIDEMILMMDTLAQSQSRLEKQLNDVQACVIKLSASRPRSTLGGAGDVASQHS